MLFRSGDNLFESTKSFINDSESITIFSAYILLHQLEKMNKNKTIKQIVVRWEIQDLYNGISDLELYNYCRINNIILYRNTRLHMKAFWNHEDKLVYGSANVTGKGVGEKGNYNYELNGIEKNLSFEDRIYLNNIIASSQYVTDNLYEKLKNLIESIELPIVKYPELLLEKNEDDKYLMSQLPMSASPNNLYEVSAHSIEFHSIQKNCAAHDIALYEINPFQEYLNFKSELKEKFNNQPFIRALKDFIINQESKSLRYGGVVNWIQKNTTTVPIPRRWDLKKQQIVNILYEWICEFDSDFTWDTPNHSQVIYYKQNTK
ncbi:hypothetical protein [Maribacter dokdonensis]|uniref:hypothetical protein n=1 Tax=Maribacter dokdonensis TaxID=320912 RepID=UPI0032988426